MIFCVDLSCLWDDQSRSKRSDDKKINQGIING
jgi:hypothetical protein